MYPNLNAEMARRNITVMMLSERTGIKYNTLAAKLRGKQPVMMSDAKKIRDAISEDLTVDYLFADEIMAIAE